MNNYDGSPKNNKLAMASAGQGSPLRSQLALKLKSNTPKKLALTPSPTVQVSNLIKTIYAIRI